MLCDKYKKALITAAASGTALPSSLDEHVKACAYCRDILTAEQALLAAIDAGLRKTANVREPSSFLPQVRAEVAAERPRERILAPAMAFVCAIALAVVIVALPRRAHEQIDTRSVPTIRNTAPAGGGTAVRVVPESKTAQLRTALEMRTQPNVSAAVRHEPEVLVEPEQEELLTRFYASVQNPLAHAGAVAASDQEAGAKSLVIRELAVNELKIEDLEQPGLPQTNTK
jgi:hypothetical protein